MRHWSLIRMLCCPFRSPFNASSRFPGGARKSSKRRAWCNSLGFRGQSLVVRVNHGGRVARLLCGLVFVGVRGKVVGAKGVAQSVGFARDFRLCAEFAIVFQKCSFFTRPEFSSLVSAVRFKP